MKLPIDTRSIESYRAFLRVKQLPSYRFRGHVAEFPDEYAKYVSGAVKGREKIRYNVPQWMFDYQRDITALAIHRRKFAVFADCGLGKTPILLEFARWASRQLGQERRVLIISPLMVVKQTLAESVRFFGKSLPIVRVEAKELPAWLEGDGHFRIGITNYEALNDDTPQGKIGALILDESSMLKSHYGKWGATCIRLGRGLDWKLCCTGTPAPNDRIEYANHAVFLDAFPTVNSFLAKFFVNRGQTQERWELKQHALEGFYRALSHWSIFLTNPATYGWKDNATGIPPINVHIHDVDLTDAQQGAVYAKTRRLFVDQVGGIQKRSTLAQIGKGFVDGKDIGSAKPAFIRSLIDSWPSESTILWCHYNAEQDQLAGMFPEAANIDGGTPHPQREKLIDDFKAGRRKVLISKPRILGFGLNLQMATRQIFSSLQDSYEEYYQAVKRSNRIGSTNPLNVHIPVTEVERPMVDNVLRKSGMVQRDTEEQERIFKNASRI